MTSRIFMKLANYRFLPIAFFVFASLVQLTSNVFADDLDNSCVNCHSSSKFLVENKKLYDYYQNWLRSAHFREGVECQDCHGGNPKKANKNDAHGSRAVRGASDPKSDINAKNIPKTCKKCHDDIYDAYQTSKHFKKLQKNGEGPNCVTCHGSLNVTVLKVNTVKATCEKCHNEEKDNSPEIPGKAETLLEKYLIDRRLYRWVAAHDPSTSKESTKNDLGKRIGKLAALWHTFDLDEIRDTAQQLRTDIKNAHIEPGQHKPSFVEK
jgi:hypothetical protein